MEKIERRVFMKGAAVGTFVFAVSGGEVLLTAREARAQAIPLKVLTADEQAAWRRWEIRCCRERGTRVLRTMSISSSGWNPASASWWHARWE